ncbi:MAG: hypothetical protein PVH19_12905, partial [Planctomycetia bacterium]
PFTTADAIDAALEGSAIFGEDTGSLSGNVVVRYVSEALDEWYYRELTNWGWFHINPNDAIYEITFQGAAHDTTFDITVQNSSLTPDTIPQPEIIEYTRADDGLAQVHPSSGMTPDGSFVVAWTQYEEYTDGTFSNTNIYFREYKENYDSAGPRVTDFLLPDGDRLRDGEQINSALSNIVVTFDEELATSGEGSVLDTENWALMKYDSDGTLVEIRGGISEVFFGMNSAASMATTLGLNPLGTNKWEAILTLDGNGNGAGVEALEDGHYVIVAKSNLRDPSLNPLGFTGYDIDGYDILTSFTITLPTGSETLVNSELVGEQETLPESSSDIAAGVFPNSPQAISGDADGEHVVVWTQEGDGVYAKIYPFTWIEDANGERQSIQELPIEIQVTDNPTAMYASVARDGDGDFVVTWSAQDGTGDWDIWYQTFDAKGRATRDAQIVNADDTENPYTQQFSTVAIDNDGDFVITWQSQEQDGSGAGIYAQRFTYDGEKLGGLNEIQTLELNGNIDLASFGLNFDYTDPAMMSGAISYNATDENAMELLVQSIQDEIDLLGIGATVSISENNEYLIVIEYTDVDSCKNVPPIILDVYSLVGDENANMEMNVYRNGMSSEFLVNGTIEGDQMWPSIAMDHLGHFVVTWTSFGQDGDTAYESNIYARKFDWNDDLVDQVEELQKYTLSGEDITSPTFNSIPLGSEFLVNHAFVTYVLDTTVDPPVITDTIYDTISIDGNQKWSSVAMDADGDFVITWTSYNLDGVGNGYGPGYNGENGIFARRFDKDFIDASSLEIPEDDDTHDGDDDDDTTDDTEEIVPEYGVFQVNTFAENDQQHSAVAMDTDGDFIITWESFQEKPAVGAGPDSPVTFGIYAQRYAGNERLGTSTSLGINGEEGGEIHVNTETEGDQRFPSVTIDDTGDAVIVWNGTNAVDTDGGVFLQRFEKLEDEAGPRVTSVECLTVAEDDSTEIERIANGDSTKNEIAQMIITFGEDLNTEYLTNGDNSILNLDNWELGRLLSNGGTDVIEGGIASITFGRDEAYYQGLTTMTSGKYQAVVTFDYSDYRQDESEEEPWLAYGKYVLTIKEEVQDLFGNAIQPNPYVVGTDDFRFEFSVKGSDTEETPLNPIGGEDDLLNGRTYPESPGAVAVDGDGDYVAVWIAYDESMGVDRVFMMRYDTTGTPLWADPQPVTPTGFGTDSQRYATVACDPDGDFVVTWTNYRDEDGSDTNGQEQIDIYAQRFSALGVPQGSAFRVNSYTAGEQIWSNVAMDVEGGFVVTWSSKGQENNGMPGYGYGVYARQFDPLGYALASEFQVNVTTGGNQQFSSVAVAADGTFAITWQSDQNGIGKDIVARAFQPDGAPQVSPLGGEYIVNDTHSGDQTYPDIAIDLSGET